MQKVLLRPMIRHPRLLATIRVCLIAVLLVAGWYVGRGFATLWSEWRLSKQPVASRQTNSADLNSMAAVLPLAGQWSFAELDWNLGSEIAERKVVEARLELLAATPVGDTAEQFPEAGKELFELVEKLQVRPIERGGNQIYRVDHTDLKAELVVRKLGEHSKVIGLLAALPHGDSQWQLFTLTPNRSNTTSYAAAPSLLPLPGGAHRTGGRFGDDGRPLLELISLDSRGDDLISTWKNQGWEVRPSGLGDPNAFSYLCGRGEEVIYAWSANDRNALQNLMLVRTANSTDTGP